MTAGRIGLIIAELDTLPERFAALLQTSEIEAGSRRSGFAEVRLAPPLTSVVELYQPLAEKRGIVLRLNIRSDAVVFGDHSPLFQALSNPADSAIKFAP